jgi:hypothetical protein
MDEAPFTCSTCGGTAWKQICLECDCPWLVAWARGEVNDPTLDAEVEINE